MKINWKARLSEYLKQQAPDKFLDSFIPLRAVSSALTETMHKYMPDFADREGFNASELPLMYECCTEHEIGFDRWVATTFTKGRKPKLAEQMTFCTVPVNKANAIFTGGFSMQSGPLGKGVYLDSVARMGDTTKRATLEVTIRGALFDMPLMNEDPRFGFEVNNPYARALGVLQPTPGVVLTKNEIAKFKANDYAGAFESLKALLSENGYSGIKFPSGVFVFETKFVTATRIVSVDKSMDEALFFCESEPLKKSGRSINEAVNVFLPNVKTERDGFFTEKEARVIYGFKNKEYVIEFNDWLKKHFRAVVDSVSK